MSLPTPEQIAERLETLYESAFGGKARGRFKITDRLMRGLAERGRIETILLVDIQAETRKVGIELLKLDGFYALLEISKILSWRPAPSRLVRHIVGKG